MRDLPPHGTRRRYRRFGCRCVACTRQGKGPEPEALMWPFKHLEREIGMERIRDWYDEDTITRWRSDGLGDFEADEVAIHYGRLAHNVWPGWTTAGLDSDVYP